MNARYRRGSVIGVAVALVVLCATAAWAVTPETKPEVKSSPDLVAQQQMYMAYLKDQGFAPELRSERFIEFKCEGKTCCIALNKVNPLEFWLILPNIWQIESDAERRKVLAAADYANGSLHAVKVYTIKDNVWVSIELFMARPDDFKIIFSRARSALMEGYGKFVQKMKE